MKGKKVGKTACVQALHSATPNAATPVRKVKPSGIPSGRDRRWLCSGKTACTRNLRKNKGRNNYNKERQSCRERKECGILRKKKSLKTFLAKHARGACAVGSGRREKGRGHFRDCPWTLSFRRTFPASWYNWELEGSAPQPGHTPAAADRILSLKVIFTVEKSDLHVVPILFSRPDRRGGEKGKGFLAVFPVFTEWKVWFPPSRLFFGTRTELSSKEPGEETNPVSRFFMRKGGRSKVQ